MPLHCQIHRLNQFPLSLLISPLTIMEILAYSSAMSRSYGRMLPCEKTTILETVDFVSIHRGKRSQGCQTRISTTVTLHMLIWPFFKQILIHTHEHFHP